MKLLAKDVEYNSQTAVVSGSRAEGSKWFLEPSLVRIHGLLLVIIVSNYINNCTPTVLKIYQNDAQRTETECSK